MKHSAYIQWAKEHHDITYNLASSGVPTCDLNTLVHNPKEILKTGEHEDGWAPLKNTLSTRYGISSDQVLPVHSASFANHLVCALLLNPGDEVLVEHPVYEPLLSLPKYFNSSVKQFARRPEQNYQPDLNEIEQLVSDNTQLIILTDLHNPSGSLLDRKILEELAKLATKHNIYILIDEVYLEFFYPDGERTSAAISDRIITTRSLTKSYGLDDIRVGWITAKSTTIQKIQRLQDLFITSMAFPSERLALSALKKADKMLKENLNFLDTNLGLVEEFIAGEPMLSWKAPQKGSVGFVQYKPGSVDQLAKHLLANYQTLIAPGRFFGMDNYFRIGWSILNNTLKNALSNLEKAIEDLK